LHSLLRDLFLAGDLETLRTLTSTSVGLCLLSANRKAATMAETAVTTDLHEALNVLRTLATKVTFDDQVTVNEVAKLASFFLGEVTDERVP